jgi:predicted RNA-binding protein YlqC (UPF0109 family)
VSEIDQQFIEYVVKSLVGKPDSVKVDRRIDEKGVLLELTVDPEDLGRVIGKRGATAQSLRTLLRALGTKNDARYNLKIIDNGVEGGGSGHGAPVAADNNASDAQVSSTPPPADDQVDEPSDEAEEPAAEPEEEQPTESVEDQTSERLKQAREELADLDDLDV